ncbi:hypothetical protein WJX84_007162 [Apatococcus fuscideae]|uniref:Uncharacterized protein n=1 Tax=Apatococcus fuscideae TaxID=2026836 RepID=A0AAW1SKZ7_9CHLO
MTFNVKRIWESSILAVGSQSPLHIKSIMRKRRKSVVDPQQLEQVLDLPEHGQGLAWVARRNPGELLLIPDVHATSITAAAAGH